MFLLFVKLSMGPLFLFQAMRLRKKIIMLPDPTGERIGTTGSGKPLRLAIVGDSAAVGVGVETQDESLKGCLVKRLGADYSVSYKIKAKTGATSRDTRKYLRSVPAQDFDVALVSLGVNDLTTGMSKLAFIKVQTDIIKILREKFSVKHIILSGLPPVGRFPAIPQPSRWYLGKVAKDFDDSLQEIALRHDCSYLAALDSHDQTLLARDGFHPGPKVYDIWAKKVYENILGQAPSL